MIIAGLFNVKRKYAWSIWRRAQQCLEAVIPVDVTYKRTKNYGRKKIHINLDHVAIIDLNRRTTIRSLAEALHVNKSSLYKALKKASFIIT